MNSLLRYIIGTLTDSEIEPESPQKLIAAQFVVVPHCQLHAPLLQVSLVHVLKYKRVIPVRVTVAFDYTCLLL